VVMPVRVAGQDRLGLRRSDSMTWSRNWGVLRPPASNR
jgi:hypothetical protein